MTIISCMVPATWSALDRIFCHFGPFFALLHPNNPKNQNFEKMKKMAEDIIILHMCTKNYDHMINSSSDMVCGRRTNGWTDRRMAYRGGCPT